jgi:hypothetical protein
MCVISVTCRRAADLVAVLAAQAPDDLDVLLARFRRSDRDIGVGQENDVPTGLLDGPWSDVAYMVAASAQDGIMQPVARGAPPSPGKS